MLHLTHDITSCNLPNKTQETEKFRNLFLLSKKDRNVEFIEYSEEVSGILTFQ